MTPINFKEIPDYSQITVNGIPCLFTNLRIDRKSLPQGLHAYDIRDSDDGSDFATIECLVLVNHTDTILTDREIPMTEGDYTPIEDYDFTENESSQRLLDTISSM